MRPGLVRTVVVAFLATTLPTVASAQFTDVGAGLQFVFRSALAWGDYDADGDLDLLVTGTPNGTVRTSIIYRNDAGSFTDIGAGLEGVQFGSAAWGDYDADGDLDVLLTGETTNLGPVSKIYRNDSGTFSDINAGLAGVQSSAAAWGDYDNDGDLDVLLSGLLTTRIYRNDGAGVFTDINASLQGVENAALAWGDYDADGDLDFVLTGNYVTTSSWIYRNDGGTFVDIGAGLAGVHYGSVAWGDYDADGDLDLLLAGQQTGGLRVSKIYRNDGGAFTDIAAAIEGMYRGSVAWGDYDADGDLDILMAGSSNAGLIARVYRNDAGLFTDVGAGLDGVWNSSVAWGDFDGDDDLDIALSGLAGSPVTRIYRNDGVSSNTPPTAPTTLVAEATGGEATFTWFGATDAETPTAGLNYNLRIGTTPGGGDVAPAMADAVIGWRRVPQRGPVQATSWVLRIDPALAPAGTTLYWSVQTIDASFGGSPFAPEQSVVVQGLTDIGAGLTGVDYSSVAWGDYDADGDLDALVTGDSGPSPVSTIYRNDAGVFVDIGAGLVGVRWGSAAWGDYDRDGDLDVLLTGFDGSTAISRIYRNDAGVFVDIGAGLPGVAYSSVAWGDYDNDGALDILLTGTNGTTRMSRIYRNRLGNFFGPFVDIGAGLQPLESGSAAWGDYDADGDLDVLLTGDSGSSAVSKIYRNDAGAFVDIGAGLTGVLFSSAAWGDYDLDGDLDLVLAGSTSGATITSIYRNDAGVFVDVGAGLPGVQFGAVAWGDHDNDGDLDLLLAGSADASRIYRNDAGTFGTVSAGLPGVRFCSVGWGDYDGDGDLDVLLTGTGTSSRVAAIHRNDGFAPNTPPSTPASLSAEFAIDAVTFTWSGASDAQTPAAGLSYNLRIGTTPGGSDVFAATADAVTGLRQVPQRGPVQTTSWVLETPSFGALSPGTQLHWSVQAIDAAFAGSAFAPEETVVLTGFGLANVYFEGVDSGSSAWGDYDADGDLDLFLSGRGFDGFPVAKLHRNDGGTFTDLFANLVGVRNGSAEWGDYDNDGDLDLLVTGHESIGIAPHTAIYRNETFWFQEIVDGLVDVGDGSAAWGDYDNDGDLDILVAGSTGVTGVSRIYRNDAGTFTDIGAGLAEVLQCTVAWVDYDVDGDLDAFISGRGANSAGTSRVYRNDGGAFTDVGAGLEGVSYASADWSDFDADGDPDLLLAGRRDDLVPVSRLYRNDAGTFTDVGAGLLGIERGSVAWGDYDNDGDPDVLLTGWQLGSVRASKVYRNDAGAFTDIQAGVESLDLSSATWADFDGDGDLDILLIGSQGQPLSLLYRNEGFSPNTAPTPPTSLSVQAQGGIATFAWSGAGDAETPASALTSNLRIGTTPGGAEIKSSMADAASGFRQVVALGNLGQVSTWTLELPLVQQQPALYWSVQSIDSGLEGSLFAEEQTLWIAPGIRSITDLDNDQGRQVRIVWNRCVFDAPGVGPPVIREYAVWRRPEPSLGRAQDSIADPFTRAAAMDVAWDFIGTVPARGNTSYALVAPTLCDSTAAGVCETTYFVSAMTDDPFVFFDSPPDSGYSIDNLAPAVPSGLVATLQGDVQLTWTEVDDADLQYYTVYRDVVTGFVPGEGNRIGFSASPSLVDASAAPGALYFYVVTATDFAGNEGAPSPEAQVDLTATAVAPMPRDFALDQNRPNPFNPSTTIRFELPRVTAVTLTIFDSAGRRVRTLVQEERGAGTHEVTWKGRDDQGAAVSSGVYFYELRADAFVQTRRMILVK